MVAASKLDDREERVEHPILPDWKELVFPATIMAATVAFIKSERGRRWYESIGKSTPDTEKLAKRLFYGVGGTISEPTFWGPTLAFTLLDFIQPRALMRYRLQKENPPPSLLHVLKTFVVSYVTQYYVIGYVQKKFVYPMWRKGVRERDFYVRFYLLYGQCSLTILPRFRKCPLSSASSSSS
ncbi:hypothetical protein DFJ74DRAFT_120835 [Hyaloraphidium curvatum]|nr:hypothetical protein DFJ74DRAFT_120835 [Hyaloraphidium curvatum]